MDVSPLIRKLNNKYVVLNSSYFFIGIFFTILVYEPIITQTCIGFFRFEK